MSASRSSGPNIGAQPDSSLSSSSFGRSLLPSGAPSAPLLQQEIEVKTSYKVLIEPFQPKGRSDPEFELLMRLEQRAWDKPGISIPDREIKRRIFGDEEEMRIPNPVLVCRVNGKIEGAIFTAVTHSDGLKHFPQRYRDVSVLHDPDGDTILDYSVITNPDSAAAKSLRLFDPLVKSTLTLANSMGKKHVVAYSRGEFFLGHIRFNPAFDRFDSGDSQAELDAIFNDFRSRHHPATFFDLVQNFKFELPQEKLIEAAEIYPRWTKSAAKPSPETLGEYFSMKRWDPAQPGFKFKDEKEAFLDYADFHFREIGDRFQGPNHERLGAKYIGTIFRSRREDLRSGFSNVLMAYNPAESG